jgi:Zn-dependent protease
MVAALERALTTNARVTLLTLLPVPPLDGFRIIC